MEQNLCEYCYCMHNGNQVCKKYVDAQINKVKQEPQITKWEYTNVFIKDSADWVHIHDMGRNGWELVSVDNYFAYFKRPLIK